jgi:DNA-binding NtrC family response regulator
MIGNPKELAGGEVMVGESAAMRNIRTEIRDVAKSDSNILITGETGTGKELVAALVHGNSPRKSKPLVCINCAAIPDALFESELFGFERGAFTGAVATYEGKLKGADGGTLFFDEIGDLSPVAQAKLLRLIETKEVQRLGGNKTFRVNVRIAAATHRDLEAMARTDVFRRDLFFRLNVARIHLPALRDRRSDISLIADHAIQDFNRRLGTEVTGFEEDALESLLGYDWPGNVRELRNVIERVLLLRHAGRISTTDLPMPVRQRIREAQDGPVDELPRLLAALTATEWNKSRAAEKLQWSRMKLYRRMAKYRVLHH